MSLWTWCLQRTTFTTAANYYNYYSIVLATREVGGGTDLHKVWVCDSVGVEWMGGWFVLEKCTNH